MLTQNRWMKPPPCSLSLFFILAQQKMSNRLSWYLFSSRAIRATNEVICRRKSNNSAIVANKANVLTAGISERDPMAKQQISETLVRSILGPTLPKVSPICSCRVLSLLLEIWIMFTLFIFVKCNFIN